MSVDSRINFNLPLPVLLGGFLFAFLLVPLVVALAAINIYQAIYADVQRDMMAMLEARDRSKPITETVRTAPAMIAQPSPFEPVCRDHQGIRNVEVVWKNVVKITCHSGYMVLQ